jgi:hypothetical protein
VADRVDAVVHVAQAAFGEPAPDPIAVDPRCEQLAARDAAMLAPGDLGGNGEESPHTGTSCHAPRFAPS